MIALNKNHFAFSTYFSYRTGVFGTRLMKEWSSLDEALVLFTETHWQTISVVIICMNQIIMLYRNLKYIGLTWDLATTNAFDTVKKIC